MSLPVFAASGAGTAGSGAGAIAVSYPAGGSIGDLVILWADWKYGAVAVSMSAPGFVVPANNQATGGPGGTGVDTGDVTVAALYRILDGTEGASVNVTPSAATNVGVFQMHRFTMLPGETWDVAMAAGSSNVPGTAFSAVMGTDPGITLDDLVVVVGTVNTDTPTRSAEAVAASGASFGAAAELNDGGNGTGDDIGFWVTTHACTAGPAGGVATYTATNSSGTPAGAAVLVRLRASSPVAPPPAEDEEAPEEDVPDLTVPVVLPGLSYTMHDRVSPAPPAVRPPDRARQFGRDVKFASDTEVGPDGRYVMVEGSPALRQAVYHVLVTEPGAFRRFPGYGVGLLRYLGRALTPAAIDEVKNRISEGLLQLRRVDAVRQVAVAQPDPYTLHVQIAISAAGRLVRFQPFDFRRE